MKIRHLVRVYLKLVYSRYERIFFALNDWFFKRNSRANDREKAEEQGEKDWTYLHNIKFKHTLVCFLVLFLFTNLAEASHIVGGDLSYKCLSNDPVTNSNLYQITMKIYRNCDATSMDELDNFAPITIYNGLNPATFVENELVPLQSSSLIPANFGNPCIIIPPNLCIQEGIYVFEVTLPISTEAYTISYQRCCRNGSITNIVDPNMIGATYTIEITPEAQQLCNNSPVFNEFPPLVVCSNISIDFDHSATDEEGDQLVYELCSPLQGAGIVGAFAPGDPSGCDGFKPNPACPPPYPDVTFTLPTYSALNPMGGDPQVTIDPVSGLITGIPGALGKFAVGVCVKEYRDGILLSVTRRDFQFNVAFCEAIVEAALEGGTLIDENTYEFNLCSNEALSLVNSSGQEEFIDSYLWSFNIDGENEIASSEDLTVSFPGIGTYEGIMVVNPGASCDDSLNIIVNVFPELNAAFDFSYDTCVAGPVQFTDFSVANSGMITDWFWDFGNELTADVQNPSHMYSNPGNYEVQLQVTDINNCITTVTEPISWYPAPAIIVVEPSTFVGCEPATIQFTNLSIPIDDTYESIWRFGDGQTANQLHPIHMYDEPGIYSIDLQITSPLGCMVETSYENWITIQERPEAAFSYSPNNPNSLNPTVSFEDMSLRAINWRWDFDGESISLDRHPTYTFRDTGLQKVELVAFHPAGCTDTTIQLIDIEPIVTYYLPNAFTPNEDNVNDFYRGNGSLIGITNFNLTIWNRWGEEIFRTNQPDEGWNGRKFNTGNQAPNGLYHCLVHFSGPRGGTFEVRGYAMLIR